MYLANNQNDLKIGINTLKKLFKKFGEIFIKFFLVIFIVSETLFNQSSKNTILVKNTVIRSERQYSLLNHRLKDRRLKDQFYKT